MAVLEKCPACGAAIATKFCGHCGAQVKVDALTTLIDYLQMNLQRQKRTLETRELRAKKKGVMITDAPRRRDVIAKWESWLALARKWESSE